MQDLLDRMTRRVLRHADGMRADTPLPRVGIGVLRPSDEPVLAGCGSGVCLVLQGAKRMLIGRRLLRYGAGSCFASLVALPATRTLYETEGDRPYVATSLKLDHEIFAALIADLAPAFPDEVVPGFSTAAVPRALLEAWDHHLALLDTPEDIPVLSAARERELLYRLLQSPHGPLLRQIARLDGRLAQVRKVIEYLRHNFDRPIPIRNLAEVAGMSVPSLNRHFRAATGTSPLQYRKTLRLHAARRLLAKSTDATRAAFAVGYESPSQFSREYARLFGQPPRRDASRLRQEMSDFAEVLL